MKRAAERISISEDYRLPRRKDTTRRRPLIPTMPRAGAQFEGVSMWEWTEGNFGFRWLAMLSPYALTFREAADALEPSDGDPLQSR